MEGAKPQMAPGRHAINSVPDAQAIGWQHRQSRVTG